MCGGWGSRMEGREKVMRRIGKGRVCGRKGRIPLSVVWVVRDMCNGSDCEGRRLEKKLKGPGMGEEKVKLKPASASQDSVILVSHLSPTTRQGCRGRTTQRSLASKLRIISSAAPQHHRQPASHTNGLRMCLTLSEIYHRRTCTPRGTGTEHNT